MKEQKLKKKFYMVPVPIIQVISMGKEFFYPSSGLGLPQ